MVPTPRHSDQDSDAKLSMLLRVKRLEKPDAAFWETFDASLKARQLAASLPKRHWWHSLPRPGRGNLRFVFGTLSTVAACLGIVWLGIGGPQDVPVSPELASLEPIPVQSAPEAYSAPELPAVSAPSSVIQSAFVHDVVSRDRSDLDKPFITEAAPETLVAGISESHSVYTLSSGGNLLHF
jgi:hypothetical protein